jgi:hypothetical protein
MRYRILKGMYIVWLMARREVPRLAPSAILRMRDSGVGKEKIGQTGVRTSKGALTATLPSQ